MDYYRGRLSFRKLCVLIRQLPSESAVARALGGSGFSMLELLVMESGISGELNPRHPFLDAQADEAKASRVHLKERRAYYEAQRVAQQQTDTTEISSPDDEGRQA